MPRGLQSRPKGRPRKIWIHSDSTTGVLGIHSDSTTGVFGIHSDGTTGVFGIHSDSTSGVFPCTHVTPRLYSLKSPVN